MEIIPVIDLKGGYVVQAKMGIRAQYPKLSSCLTKGSTLLEVVTALMAWYPFKRLYIADLDAIASRGAQLNLSGYQKVLAHFPDLILWLDAGITQQRQVEYLLAHQIMPIIAGECLSDDLSVLETTLPIILSLDFKQGVCLGHGRLWQQPAHWPQQVIVMNLDRVGSDAGPDYELLMTLSQNFPAKQLIAAGGVRHTADIEQLSWLGIEKTLVASALHNGQLTRGDITSLACNR